MCCRRNLREQSALKSSQQSEAVALARQPLLLWLPAYRNLANQKQLLTPLNAEEIGVLRRGSRTRTPRPFGRLHANGP